MKLKLSILLLSGIYFSSSISMDVFENEDAFANEDNSKKSFKEQFDNLCRKKIEDLNTETIDKLPDIFSQLSLMDFIKNAPESNLYSIDVVDNKYLTDYLNLIAKVAGSNLENKKTLLDSLVKRLGKNKFFLEHADSKIAESTIFKNKLETLGNKYQTKFEAQPDKEDEAKSKEEIRKELEELFEEDLAVKTVEDQINLVHNTINNWAEQINEPKKEDFASKELENNSEEEEEYNNF